jgi:hypothetical protein
VATRSAAFYATTAPGVLSTGVVDMSTRVRWHSFAKILRFERQGHLPGLFTLDAVALRDLLRDHYVHELEHRCAKLTAAERSTRRR